MTPRGVPPPVVRAAAVPHAEVARLGRARHQPLAASDHLARRRARVITGARGVHALSRVRASRIPSPAGAWMGAAGPRTRFASLARADAVPCDGPVPLAHRGLQLAAVEALAPGAGYLDPLADEGLRVFVRAGRAASSPTLRGGHSLVHGGALAHGGAHSGMTLPAATLGALARRLRGVCGCQVRMEADSGMPGRVDVTVDISHSAMHGGLWRMAGRIAA